MPISSDRFEHLDDDTPTFEEGTNAFCVIQFLYTFHDKAFKQGEIAEETKVPVGSISVVLSRLEELGVVEHKGQYWKAAPDDRFGSFEAMLISQQTITDHYGDDEFDKDAWLEYAPSEGA